MLAAHCVNDAAASDTVTLLIVVCSTLSCCHWFSSLLSWQAFSLLSTVPGLVCQFLCE